MHLYRHAEQNKLAPVIKHAKRRTARILIGWKLISAEGTKQIGGDGAHLLSQKMDKIKPKLSPVADLQHSNIGGSQALKNRRISPAQESADLRRSRIGGSLALKNRRMKEWRRACSLERNAHVSLKKKTKWRWENSGASRIDDWTNGAECAHWSRMRFLQEKKTTNWGRRLYIAYCFYLFLLTTAIHQ